MSEKGFYIRGGNGSHWEGCEETHWDCKITKLEKENARLKKAVEEAGVKLQTIRFHLLRKGLGEIVDELDKHFSEYGKPE